MSGFSDIDELHPTSDAAASVKSVPRSMAFSFKKMPTDADQYVKPVPSAAAFAETRKNDPPFEIAALNSFAML
jgi:hypothetical protein